MANPTLPVYDRNDADLRRRVIEQIQAMSSGGVAPSIRDYTEWRKKNGNALPSASWLKPNWGWGKLIKEAKLKVRQPKREIFPTAVLEEPLYEWEKTVCVTRWRYERGW